MWYSPNSRSDIIAINELTETPGALLFIQLIVIISDRLLGLYHMIIFIFYL